MSKVTEAQKNQLVKAALSARDKAYAPYSRFYVGAALLLDNGEIITGANIENGSYGLTLCAERVALAYAKSQGKGEIRMMAISADVSPPATPCGACRQVMWELAREAQVILVNPAGETRETDVRAFLPEAFDFEPPK